MKKIIDWQDKITNKEKVILLLFSFVILYFTFVPFKVLFAFGGFYLPYAIGVIVCLLAAPMFVRTKMCVMALLYTVVLLLNVPFKTYVNLGNVLSETSSIVFTCFMVYYALKCDLSQRFLRTIVILFCIITSIYAIQTYVFFITFPGIMRWAAMLENQDDALPYFEMGLAPYAFPHGLSCIIPAFVLGLKSPKNTNKIRFFSLMMLFVSFLLIYITEATGALIVALFSLICAWISKVGSVRINLQKILIISFLFAPIVVSDSIKIGIIQGIESAVGDDSQYLPKLEELERSITKDYAGAGEGDFKTRSDLLDNTIESIMSDPLFGVSSPSFGNHNALLDRWAQYGLVAFMSIAFLIIWMIKFTMRYIPYNYHTFYLIGVSANLLMMLSKSMFAWYQWFAFLVVLPSMILFCGKIQIKNKKLINLKDK